MTNKQITAPAKAILARLTSQEIDTLRTHFAWTLEETRRELAVMEADRDVWRSLAENPLLYGAHNV